MLMWLLQVEVSLIRGPRYLNARTCSIAKPSMLMFGLVSTFLWEEWRSMHARVENRAKREADQKLSSNNSWGRDHIKTSRASIWVWERKEHLHTRRSSWGKRYKQFGEDAGRREGRASETEGLMETKWFLGVFSMENVSRSKKTSWLEIWMNFQQDSVCSMIWMDEPYC